MIQSRDPMTALQRQKTSLDIQKEQRDLNSPQLVSAGNGSFYNKDNGEFIAPPDGNLKDTPDIQNFKFARQNGYTGSFSDFITEKSRAIHNTGNIAGNTIDYDDLPPVMVNDRGVPDPAQQQAFLSKLPPDLASQVKGIMEGRISLDKVTSMKAGERQQMAKLVSMGDPTFDMSQAAARAATRRDYATGDMAKMAASTNLAIQHLSGMMDEATKLNNTNYPSWNTIKNLYASETGNPDMKSFETYRLGVADELGKAFHGMGAVPETQVKAWKDAISTSSSPEQLQQVVKSAMHMLAARTETYNTRYKNVMGRDAPDLLTPNSYAALKHMGISPRELGIAARADSVGEQPRVNDDGSMTINGYKIRKL
ncbi:hypothetical protein [Brucella anthropi]|uniref:hypothetical protein n=1 Tax=Brucella anthropi TaxID=529 RepID=UPI00235E4DDE|nr:hypothetical protein [Brucella anthropi]